LRPKLEKLQLPAGVMDVVVRFETEPVAVELIEVNVFSHNTRGSLFSWKEEQRLLEEGPLSTRIHEQPILISKW
jgi:hypothetical protein